MARTIGGRSPGLTLAKAAVTAAVIVFIVWRLGWRQIAGAFMQADYRWVAAGLAVFVASGALGTVQWQILLKNKHIDMHFAKAFSLFKYRKLRTFVA